MIELNNRGLPCQQQRSHEVFYEGHFIGNLTPDLIVDERLIVDPKVVTEFTDTHVAQMLATSALRDWIQHYC